MMKIGNLVQLQHLVIDRKVPCDVEEILNMQYFSMSKNEFIRVGDMDLVHLLRVFNMSIDYKEHYNIEKGISDEI